MRAGLIPLLGAPMGGANSEAMLAESVRAAVQRGLVRAKQHVVCVLSVRGDFMLKVVSVDDVGGGMAHSMSSSGPPSVANKEIGCGACATWDGRSVDLSSQSMEQKALAHSGTGQHAWIPPQQQHLGHRSNCLRCSFSGILQQKLQSVGLLLLGPRRRWFGGLHRELCYLLEFDSAFPCKYNLLTAFTPACHLLCAVYKYLIGQTTCAQKCRHVLIIMS